MAGFGPMAFSPFPYGPVPSSGIPSLLYVDLFNAQTVAGTKTWQVAAQAGVAETIATFKVSDDAVASLRIDNALTNDGLFSPQFTGVSNGTNRSFTLRGVKTGDGTATNACITMVGQTAADAATVNSPLLKMFNYTTEVASVSAKGAWTKTIIHTDSVAETLETWKLDEDTGSVNITNGSVSNAVFSPAVMGLGSSSNRRGLIISGRGATDSGTIPITVIDGAIGSTVTSIGTASNVVTRPVIQFTNNNTEMAQFTAAGSLTLSNPLTHKSYTVATLPSAAIAGQEVYVSDAAVAPCLAFSNGTNWKRCDNAATTVV